MQKSPQPHIEMYGQSLNDVLFYKQGVHIRMKNTANRKRKHSIWSKILLVLVCISILSSILQSETGWFVVILTILASCSVSLYFFVFRGKSRGERRLLKSLIFLSSWMIGTIVTIIMISVLVPVDESGKTMISGIHILIFFIAPIIFAIFCLILTDWRMARVKHCANSKEIVPKTTKSVYSKRAYQPQLPTIDESAIIQAEEQWRRLQSGLSSIEYELQKIDGLDGHAFEYKCAELLEFNGFSDVEVTKGSGDKGVDVLAFKDGIHYAIQCKCYSSKISNSAVQAVNSGKEIYHCQIGVVMTNRYFTASAKEAAEFHGVLLWDRDKLKEFLAAAP